MIRMCVSFIFLLMQNMKHVEEKHDNYINTYQERFEQTTQHVAKRRYVIDVSVL